MREYFVRARPLIMEIRQRAGSEWLRKADSCEGKRFRAISQHARECGRFHTVHRRVPQILYSLSGGRGRGRECCSSLFTAIFSLGVVAG